jgi:hypothetical protein
MKYSESLEKVEKILSDSGIALLNIDGGIRKLSDFEGLPTGEYFVADIRVAIPISPGK